MAYIGLQPQQKTVATSTQQLSGNAVDLEFALDRAVSKAADLLVFVGGTIQVPEVDYTAQNKTLLFVTAPASGTNNINISYTAGALATINISANTFPIGTTVAPSIRSTDSATTGIYWPSTTSVGITASGNTRVTITDSPVSSSPSTGALIVNGGVGVSQALHVGGSTHIENTEQSTNAVTGALIVSGGIGVAKDIFVGGSLDVSGAFTVAGAFNTTSSDSLIIDTPFVFLANNNLGDSLDTGFTSTYNDGTQRYTGLFRDITDGEYKLFNNLTVQPTTVVDTANVSFGYADLRVGNITATNIYGTVAGGDAITVVGNLANLSVQTTITSYGINYLYSTQAATSTTTGALQVKGGAGIVGNLYAGNVQGTYLTGTLLTAAQPNITSVGTLTSLAVTGAVTTSNIASDNHNFANGVSIITTLSTEISTANTAMKGYVDAANTIQSNEITAITNSLAGANAAMVTSVTGTAPVTSSGGKTPAISMAAATALVNGYMTSTYASKLDGIAAGATNVTNTNQLINGNAFVTASVTLTTAAQPNITSVGTLTSGALGTGFTTVGTAQGGTGLTSFTLNGAVYATSTSALTTGTLPVASGGTGITSFGTGIATFLGTPSSANLLAAVTDETGTGALVFATSPTFTTQITTPAIVKSGTSGVGDIGGVGSTFATVYATTFSGVSTTARYADLAENYLADTAYAPGTVVHFGGEFEVTQCNEDMCARVAGVVSTAPAHLMNTGLEGDNVVALALTGRVPCLVQGIVRKGDMMVSAGNGRARADYNPKIGSVIGKALEDFDGAEGVIEVVVGRV